MRQRATRATDLLTLRRGTLSYRCNEFPHYSEAHRSFLPLVSEWKDAHLTWLDALIPENPRHLYGAQGIR